VITIGRREGHHHLPRAKSPAVFKEMVAMIEEPIVGSKHAKPAEYLEGQLAPGVQSRRSVREGIVSHSWSDASRKLSRSTIGSGGGDRASWRPLERLRMAAIEIWPARRLHPLGCGCFNAAARPLCAQSSYEKRVRAESNGPPYLARAFAEVGVRPGGRFVFASGIDGEIASNGQPMASAARFARLSGTRQ